MAKKTLTYAEAMAEIDSIITKIESDELDIDNMTMNIKRVSELIEFCKAKLRSTEDEVQKILTTLNED